jgi:hypothetical protein
MDLKLKRMTSFGALAPMLILTLTALTGCAYTGADYCDDFCACEGCSDVEYDDCVDDADDLERGVDEEGCGEFYDDYLYCVDDEFACNGGKVDADGCEIELARVVGCVY